MSWAPTVIAGRSCRVRNPAYQWTSTPADNGQRAATIAGVMQWPDAQYLSEVLANTERIQTIGTATGVLERVDFDASDPLLRMFSGWYVLSSFVVQADQKYSGFGTDYPVGFSMPCSFLGAQREAVVVSTSHQVANDFGIVGVPTVVDPFATEAADGSGGWLTIDAGGVQVLRECDTSSPMTSMGTNTEPLVP